jgi:phage terminase small subunit
MKSSNHAHRRSTGLTSPSRKDKAVAARDGNPFIGQVRQLAYAERLMAFVENYVANGGNGTRAAIASGVAAAGAQVWASKALRIPMVFAEIRAKRDRVRELAGLTDEAIALLLRRTVFYDHRDLLDDAGNTLSPHLVPDSIATVIEGFKYTQWGLEYKLPSRSAAVEVAMKYLGMFEKDNKQKTDPIKELLDHIRPTAGMKVVP